MGTVICLSAFSEVTLSSYPYFGQAVRRVSRERSASCRQNCLRRRNSTGCGRVIGSIRGHVMIGLRKVNRVRLRRKFYVQVVIEELWQASLGCCRLASL